MRLISFGIFWFFINLLLESSFIPLSNVIYEHRLYLPSIGAFIAINTSLFWGIEKLKDKWNHTKKVVIVLLSIIVLIFTGATYVRNRVWENEITLWQDVVKNNPKKERGHNNLGFAYFSQGNVIKAIEHFKIAIKLSPYYPEAHYNLGNVYISQRFYTKAIRHYEIASKATYLNMHLKSHNNLGNIYLIQGLFDKAIKQYKKVLRFNPKFSSAHYNLGLAYKSKGLMEKANKHFSIARRLNPALFDEKKNQQ
jgi:tetratricopeptide (TPR) repeat protein